MADVIHKIYLYTYICILTNIDYITLWYPPPPQKDTFWGREREVPPPTPQTQNETDLCWTLILLQERTNHPVILHNVLLPCITDEEKKSRLTFVSIDFVCVACSQVLARLGALRAWHVQLKWQRLRRENTHCAVIIGNNPVRWVPVCLGGGGRLL